MKYESNIIVWAIKWIKPKLACKKLILTSIKIKTMLGIFWSHTCYWNNLAKLITPCIFHPVPTVYICNMMQQAFQLSNQANFLMFYYCLKLQQQRLSTREAFQKAFVFLTLWQEKVSLVLRTKGDKRNISQGTDFATSCQLTYEVLIYSAYPQSRAVVIFVKKAWKKHKKP